MTQSFLVAQKHSRDTTLSVSFIYDIVIDIFLIAYCKFSLSWSYGVEGCVHRILQFPSFFISIIIQSLTNMNLCEKSILSCFTLEYMSKLSVKLALTFTTCWGCRTLLHEDSLSMFEVNACGTNIFNVSL